MPASKANEGGFADAIDQAQTIPGLEAGRDLPDGFPFIPPAGTRVVDSSKDPDGIDRLTAYDDFTVGREVFTIFRPWKGCTRCADDFTNSVVTLPAKGDYVCPHTRMDDYKAIINKALEGKCILKSETEIIGKDDSISVSVYWLDQKPNYKKRRRARREAARRGEGVPPSGEEEDDDEDVGNLRTPPRT